MKKTFLLAMVATSFCNFNVAYCAPEQAQEAQWAAEQNPKLPESSTALKRLALRIPDFLLMLQALGSSPALIADSNKKFNAMLKDSVADVTKVERSVVERLRKLNLGVLHALVTMPLEDSLAKQTGNFTRKIQLMTLLSKGVVYGLVALPVMIQSGLLGEGIYDYLLEQGYINPLDGNNANDTRWEKARMWVAQALRNASARYRLVTSGFCGINSLSTALTQTAALPVDWSLRLLQRRLPSKPSDGASKQLINYNELAFNYGMSGVDIANFQYAKQDIWGNK